MIEDENIREDEGGTVKKSRAAGNVVRMIGRGEVLVTLIKCDRFFPHILYGFFLIFLVLLLNLMIEKTLVEVESNRQTLYELRIALTSVNSELIGLEKLSSVQQMLLEAGSDLGVPDNPAVIIK